jgi:two-component system, NtrC family, sensor histidine kinase HydH
MSRRLLVRLSAPAVIIGVLLFAACLASLWAVSRLQRNLSGILSENVTSLEAAQELEIQLRKLRFHSLVYMLDRMPERRGLMEEDHRGFEAALAQARGAANTPEERALIEAIETGYRRYQVDLAKSLSAEYADREAGTCSSRARSCCGSTRTPWSAPPPTAGS